MSAPRAIILSEIMRGKSFELVNDVYTIGRTENNDICIPDGTLSSNHCTLTKDGDTFLVQDQGSTNGTRINGELITEAHLKSSDILQVGGIEILYDCEEQASRQSNTTQTNINLDIDLGTTIKKEMKNINPIKTANPEDEGKKKGSGFLIVIIILVVVVVVLGYFVVGKILGN